VPFEGGITARVMAGEGEKVLWFHGYTLDASTWAELWAQLPDWSHIGVELPGHGAAAWGAYGQDLPTIARRVGRFALAQGVKHLAALSFGTIVALQVAIEFPDSFDTLLLAAPALGGGPQDKGVEARYEELERLYRLRGRGPHLRALWMQSPPDLFKGAERSPRLWQSLCEVIDRHAWAELKDFGMQVFTSHPQGARELRRIRAATLILLGENELPAFKRCAEIIRRSIPACERVYLPEIGHLCLLEAPQEVAPLIGEHLRRHSTAEPRAGAAG
jgi:pimeloyl-ACP methyl ester carboxylesterase